MPKPRTHIRMSQKAHDLLEDMCRTPGVHKSAIMEDAFWAYVEGRHHNGADPQLLDRLDRIDLSLNEIERDSAMSVETIGHFVLYWLMRTDPLPEGERDAAHRLGQRRFEHFLKQVAEKVSEEERLTHRVLATKVT